MKKSKKEKNNEFQSKPGSDYSIKSPNPSNAFDCPLNFRFSKNKHHCLTFVMFNCYVKFVIIYLEIYVTCNLSRMANFQPSQSIEILLLSTFSINM